MKDEVDKVKSELWDTCNDTIIGWIMGSIMDSIKQTIMYMLSAREIWLYLERRYAATNGSLKYKLNRELYNHKQNGSTITECFTSMRGKREKLESLDQLPQITSVGEDITKFLKALNQQNEERRLWTSKESTVNDVHTPISRVCVFLFATRRVTKDCP